MAEMALRFMKTFAEVLSTDPEISAENQVDTRITTPFSRSAIQVGTNSTSLANIILPAAPSLMTAGAGVYYFGFQANQADISIAGTRLITFNTQSALQVVGGKPIPMGWHWVEGRIVRTPSPLGYAFETRVDGEQISSGVISNTNGNNFWNAGSQTLRLDELTRLLDLVVWDDVDNGDEFTSWMGPMQVDILPAAGNGSKSEWLGSDGNLVDNYLLVDEVPAATADYVESSTDGQRDLYIIGELAEGLSPLGVRTKFYANKEGAGLRGVKPVLRQNNGVDPVAEVVGSEASLGLTPIFVTTPPLGKSPLTDAPWTRTDLTQLEFGVESSTPAP